MYMFVTRHKNVPFYRPCFQNYQVGGGGPLPHPPPPHQILKPPLLDMYVLLTYMHDQLKTAIIYSNKHIHE